MLAREQQTAMIDCLEKYFRCPEEYVRFRLRGPLSDTRGYFRFGSEATCYGGYFGKEPSQLPEGQLRDALYDTVIEDGVAQLPFDPTQIAENLYREEYVGEWRQGSLSSIARIYYFVRPALSVAVRRHLQRFHLRGWGKLPFPRWPVDCSVDNLHRQLMLLSLRASNSERIPFIWFWPNGATSAAIMTHDVEATAGRDFCERLLPSAA